MRKKPSKIEHMMISLVRDSPIIKTKMQITKFNENVLLTSTCDKRGSFCEQTLTLRRPNANNDVSRYSPIPSSFPCPANDSKTFTKTSWISLGSKIRQRPSGRQCRLQRTNVSYKCGVCVEEQAWKPVVTIYKI